MYLPQLLILYRSCYNESFGNYSYQVSPGILFSYTGMGFMSVFTHIVYVCMCVCVLSPMNGMEYGLECGIEKWNGIMLEKNLCNS